MNDYFIERPTDIIFEKNAKKLITKEVHSGNNTYEDFQALVDKYPEMNQDNWWCIAMIIKMQDKLYGQLYYAIAVSDVKENCTVNSGSTQNKIFTNGIKREFSYNGHSLFVGWAGGDGGMSSYAACNISIYEEMFTGDNDENVENAANKLIDSYIASGGLMPWEQSSDTYEKVEYTRINWKNKSTSLETPINESNLNKMDKAISELCANLDVAHTESEVKKLDKSSANKLLSETPTWDSDTGILAFKFFDGTQFSVDFNIEKIPVSFSMDSSGVITMETADGTKWTADISKAIPSAYTFSNGERITFTETTSDDGTKKITADLVKGSITDEYLATDFLAKITSNVNAASSSATSAASSATDAAADAKLAQSYAIGGSGMRDGEDTDNAKYYAEQAKTEKEKIESDLSDVAHFEDATGFGEAVAPDNPSMAEDITQLKKEVSNLSEIVGSISTTQF